MGRVASSVRATASLAAPPPVARPSTSLVSRFGGRGAINYPAVVIREKREGRRGAATSLPASNSDENNNSCTNTVNHLIIFYYIKYRINLLLDIPFTFYKVMLESCHTVKHANFLRQRLTCQDAMPLLSVLQRRKDEDVKKDLTPHDFAVDEPLVARSLPKAESVF